MAVPIVRILTINFLIIKGASSMYESSYHYLLMSNHLSLQKKIMAVLKPLGLSTGQPKVLDHLRYHNGASQKDIAHACHIEPASLTSILNRMEKQHMIERKNLNGNRRSFHIFLTDYGMELSESIEKAFLSLEQEVFSGISNAEKEQFLKIFEKLYKNYKNLVYKIAYSILKNSYDSDDIVQIVFEKIYSIDKDKLPTRNESSWLYSVTKNETINYLNKKKNHIELEEIYEIEDNNNEINELINKDSYNRLIGKLNENEKEIISLKILSNLSFKEIAKLLNKPTGTIKWIYYKSINTLKLLLSNFGMFLISFISSIIALKSGKKSAPQINADSENSSKENTSSIKNETEKNDDSTLSRDDENTIAENNYSQIHENTISDASQHINNNYIGISLVGVSTIFFVLTIILLIIFSKYQLKLRKKLSK